MSNFSDPKAIADYAENATRRIPGLSDVHRMSALLMDESTPADGRVLVIGAGGGMELKSFARSFPACAISLEQCRWLVLVPSNV